MTGGSIPKSCHGVYDFFEATDKGDPRLESSITEYLSGYIQNPPMTHSAGDNLAAKVEPHDAISSKQYALTTLYELYAQTVATGRFLSDNTDYLDGLNNDLSPVPVDGDLIDVLDFASLSGKLCLFSGTPYWVYAELENEKRGWRNVPLFISLLAYIEACTDEYEPIILSALSEQVLSLIHI